MNISNPPPSTGVQRRRTAIAEIEKLVCEQRNFSYGDAEDNFAHIAYLWSWYLGHPISAQDVAILMTLFKIARSRANSTHRDSLLDAGGYIVCALGIQESMASKRLMTKEVKEDTDP